MPPPMPPKCIPPPCMPPPMPPPCMPPPPPPWPPPPPPPRASAGDASASAVASAPAMRQLSCLLLMPDPPWLISRDGYGREKDDQQSQILQRFQMTTATVS